MSTPKQPTQPPQIRPIASQAVVAQIRNAAKLAARRPTTADIVRRFAATDASGVVQILTAVHGAQALNVLKQAHAQVDVDAIIDELLAQYEADAWDGTSPINGVHPDTVRGTHQMRDGDGAYWIARSGQVVVFQPVRGVTDPVQLQQMAAEHLRQLVEIEAQERVAQAVLELVVG